MTEAKLNYMIGETDAVLRSMCVDTEENGSASNLMPLSTRYLSSPESSCDESNHYAISAEMSKRRSAGETATTTTADEIKKAAEKTEASLEELTRAYLDSYREQLDKSRRELSERMAMLEKEKERVARMTDARKREMFTRRRAAVKAFKLERERELRNAQLAKIDELKARLEELNNVNIPQRHIDLPLDHLDENMFSSHGDATSHTVLSSSRRSGRANENVATSYSDDHLVSSTSPYSSLFVNPATTTTTTTTTFSTKQTPTHNNLNKSGSDCLTGAMGLEITKPLYMGGESKPLTTTTTTSSTTRLTATSCLTTTTTTLTTHYNNADPHHSRTNLDSHIYSPNNFTSAIQDMPLSPHSTPIVNIPVRNR